MSDLLWQLIFCNVCYYKLHCHLSSPELVVHSNGIICDVLRQVCPSHIPDLSSDGPLILSGRYKGNFPKALEIKGVLGDFSDFVIDMKIQEAKDIPVQRVMFSVLPSVFTIQVCPSFFLKTISKISREDVPNFD